MNDKQQNKEDIPNFTWLGAMGLGVIVIIFYLCYLLMEFMGKS